MLSPIEQVNGQSALNETLSQKKDILWHWGILVLLYKHDIIVYS